MKIDDVVNALHDSHHKGQSPEACPHDPSHILRKNCRSCTRRIIAEALSAEREACAKVVLLKSDEHFADAKQEFTSGDDEMGESHEHVGMELRALASAIRERE